MKLALLLPGLVPDLRWFIGAARADLIVLDDVNPWSRKSRVHRYQIRTPQGTHWLNVPVIKASNVPLSETMIEPTSIWPNEHIRTMQMNYRNSLYYDFLEAEVVAIMKRAGQLHRLVDACMLTTTMWAKFLELDIQFVMASQLPEWNPDPDILAQNMGASNLIMEHNSQHYQRQPTKVRKIEIPHPEYRQHFGGYFSECGILDYIFSTGPYKLRNED